MVISTFTSDIIHWYGQNKRSLPWRETTNPYSIWLSEIILQQTRVSQGLPYYLKFLKLFPTVQKLAAAEEEQVLRAWQGLGYYSRARNMHKCAKILVNEHHGKFPTTMEALKKLPGIGNYTAAAVASLAFEEAVAVVDGNVYRVLSRYFGLETDISSSQAHGEFYELAKANMEGANPGDFNQAMMEFGAIQCIPRQPPCNDCPLQQGCVAYSKNLQSSLPVKTKKIKIRNRYFHYFLIQQGDNILMKQRVLKDIWEGLYEFLLIETKEPSDLSEIQHPLLKYVPQEQMKIHYEDKIIRHVLSHQILNVNFVVVKVDKEQSLTLEGFNWYNIEEVESLPKPVLISNYLDSYLNSIHLQ